MLILFLDDICLSNDSLYTLSWNLVTSIKNISIDLNLMCFPNPFNSHVELLSKSTDELDFILYNMVGTRVFRQKFNGSTSLPVSEIKEGLYFYVFRDVDGVIIKGGKLIKE